MEMHEGFGSFDGEDPFIRTGREGRTAAGGGMGGPFLFWLNGKVSRQSLEATPKALGPALEVLMRACPSLPSVYIPLLKPPLPLALPALTSFFPASSAPFLCPGLGTTGFQVVRVAIDGRGIAQSPLRGLPIDGDTTPRMSCFCIETLAAGRLSLSILPRTKKL